MDKTGAKIGWVIPTPASVWLGALFWFRQKRQTFQPQIWVLTGQLSRVMLRNTIRHTQTLHTVFGGRNSVCRHFPFPIRFKVQEFLLLCDLVREENVGTPVEQEFDLIGWGPNINHRLSQEARHTMTNDSGKFNISFRYLLPWHFLICMYICKSIFVGWEIRQSWLICDA